MWSHLVLELFCHSEVDTNALMKADPSHIPNSSLSLFWIPLSSVDISRLLMLNFLTSLLHTFGLFFHNTFLKIPSTHSSRFFIVDIWMVFISKNLWWLTYDFLYWNCSCIINVRASWVFTLLKGVFVLFCFPASCLTLASPMMLSSLCL